MGGEEGRGGLPPWGQQKPKAGGQMIIRFVEQGKVPGKDAKPGRLTGIPV